MDELPVAAAKPSVMRMLTASSMPNPAYCLPLALLWILRGRGRSVCAAEMRKESSWSARATTLLLSRKGNVRCLHGAFYLPCRRTILPALHQLGVLIDSSTVLPCRW